MAGIREKPLTDVAIRQATPEDAEALHTLIGAHLDEGHLLPRTAADLRAHARRFVLCEAGGKVVVPPFGIQIGRCAVVQDPWGNEFVLLDASKGLLVTDEEGNVIGNTAP